MLNKDHKEFIKNNKLILKTQQRFKRERHNVFTKEINNIALSTNGDKRMHSIDSIETYAYGPSKDLVCKKEELQCNNIIKQYKNFNIDYITKEYIKEHNANWPHFPDNHNRILIAVSSGSGKTNSLFDLTSYRMWGDQKGSPTSFSHVTSKLASKTF